MPTQVMAILEHSIKVYGGREELKNADVFKYLGQFSSTPASLNQRSEPHSPGHSKQLRRDIYRELTVKTKVKVYVAICLPILLHSSESWTLYSKQVRRLEAFHIRCLQCILGITWRNRVPHVDLFQTPNTTCIESMIITRQLRWVGHVIRMPENRLPRQVLFGELRDGTRATGGQKKRFKDQLKRNLKKCGIEPNQLETLASDRCTWRLTIKKAAETFEGKRTATRNL
ncbi:uncharacterized protein LOC143037400 [Oratosquilla oratoria]|uniref:uncharacterized protein LOC143037400 n=1 Tax=Oratosquilla oratoria TaxID=337810 RepID=UPI003F764F37